VPGSGGLARGGPPLLSVRVGVRVHWYLGRQDVRMSDICPPIAAPLGDVTTERLLLCRFDRDVLDDLVCVFDSREVWEFPYGRGMTSAETAVFLDTQIRHWEDFGFGCWTVRERQGGVPHRLCRPIDPDVPARDPPGRRGRLAVRADLMG
jgi:hypothetical protein